MKNAEKSCRICGAQLATPATGRPPAYCGASCRKFAEHAVRRLDRRLEKIAVELSEARVALAVAGGRQAPERIKLETAAWKAELELAEAQMRILLECAG